MRRWIPTLVALLLFGGLVALYLWADRSVYRVALAWLGVTDAGLQPFLDTHAVLSALHCHRQGFDVYVENPCDILRRLHAYTPFWLLASPLPFDVQLTPVFGVLLALLFVGSLIVLPPARGGMALFLLILSIVSTTTVYALERGNNDLIIWLLIVPAVILMERAWLARVCGYALIVMAGLLKLYPMALLAFAVLEKPRRFFGVGFVALLLVLSAVVPDLPHWRQTGATTQVAKHSIDMFGATNLPYALADGLARFGWHFAWLGPVLLALCSLYAAGLALRLTLRFDLMGQLAQLPDRERFLLFAGGLLLVGCFFAGTNGYYRGIYFLLVLPGLFALWRGADRDLARVAGAATTFVPVIMWAEGIRHALGEVVVQWGGEAIWRERIDQLVWVAHELLVWWEIALLMAVIMLVVRGSATGDWIWRGLRTHGRSA